MEEPLEGGFLHIDLNFNFKRLDRETLGDDALPALLVLGLAWTIGSAVNQ
jgi:hypothetical protein